jgi:integration host factor subunit beta
MDHMGPSAVAMSHSAISHDAQCRISHDKETGMTNGSMTKAELVEEVSRVSDLTKKHSEVIVDTVFKSIIDALHRGEKIELRGFGSFRLRKREPRKGRNPKTGDKVDVPPKKVPYFKPGKELKELINRETAPATPAPPGEAVVPPDAMAV